MNSIQAALTAWDRLRENDTPEERSRIVEIATLQSNRKFWFQVFVADTDMCERLQLAFAEKDREDAERERERLLN